VNRLVGLILHNWPLKVLAIALAFLLYAGLVVSQTALDFTGGVPISVVNQPTSAYVLSNLPPVTRIRYIASGDTGAQPTALSFRATVDLAGVNPSAGATYVKVDVESLDPRFAVIDYEPRGVNVVLDPFKTKTVPVTVKLGPVPSGLEVKQPTIDPQQVEVSGPASVVDLVVAAEADVVIDPQPVFVDRDIPLRPVDLAGNFKTPVEVKPASAHVTIPVFSNATTQPMPVNPVTTGTPPAGYEISGITVDPTTVLVEGDPDALAAINVADTQPIPVGGATSTITVDVPFALPSGVVPVDHDTVHVVITIGPKIGTRTYDAALVVTGRAPGLDYAITPTSVLVTIGGPIADLDRLSAGTFTVPIDVAGLAPGTHDVQPVPSLQAGLELLGVGPPTVKVVVTAQGSPVPASAGP
jgi:YbbR domain-containing protein